tara:strand:+ start:211 stop:456 length:246 start_codon:yes stop_codon:yes gene_type:complete
MSISFKVSMYSLTPSASSVGHKSGRLEEYVVAGRSKELSMDQQIDIIIFLAILDSALGEEKMKSLSFDNAEITRDTEFPFT